jgi:hypothetical protein
MAEGQCHPAAKAEQVSVVRWGKMEGDGESVGMGMGAESRGEEVEVPTRDWIFALASDDRAGGQPHPWLSMRIPPSRRRVRPSNRSVPYMIVETM